MALRWAAGLCALALVGSMGCRLEPAISSSADLGIAARLGYERVEELRRTTSAEYRETERQLARAERVVKRVQKKAGDEASDRLDELLAAYDRMLDSAPRADGERRRRRLPRVPGSVTRACWVSHSSEARR